MSYSNCSTLFGYGNRRDVSIVATELEEMGYWKDDQEQRQHLRLSDGTSVSRELRKMARHEGMNDYVVKARRIADRKSLRISVRGDIYVAIDSKGNVVVHADGVRDLVRCLNAYKDSDLAS